MWIVADINMKILGRFDTKIEAEEYANSLTEEVSVVYDGGIK